jgi:hypothetical protein
MALLSAFRNGLSAMDFPLLAWYQQAGMWWKAAESGKWSRYFTLTLKNIKYHIIKAYLHIRFQSVISQ